MNQGPLALGITTSDSFVPSRSDNWSPQSSDSLTLFFLRIGRDAISSEDLNSFKSYLKVNDKYDFTEALVVKDVYDYLSSRALAVS